MNRSTESEHFRLGAEGEARFCSALPMESDAVLTRNEPFECRVILLGALSFIHLFLKETLRPVTEKSSRFDDL
jgi:hypothetical protein